MATSEKKADQNTNDPASMTISQESELNAKAAAEETFEQKMAFETYYRMGEKRSITKLAKEMDKHRSTLELWSSKYRWVHRVKEREKAMAEYLLLQQDAKQEADTKNRQLKLIDGTIAIWAKKLQDKEIKITSIDDLEKLINLRWKVAGIPDKQVNPTHARTHGGTTVDLRLRNMERPQMIQFLHSTLKSIERIMQRDMKPAGKALPPNEERDVQEMKEKISLDLHMETDGGGGNGSSDMGVIDLDDEDLMTLDVDDADISID